MKSSDSAPITLLIVDDHRMVGEGLRAMLRATLVEVVAEAETIEQALSEIARARPDAVLLDIRLQGQSGLDACRIITEKYP